MNDSGLIDLPINSNNGNSEQGIFSDTGNSNNSSLSSADNTASSDSSIDADSSTLPSDTPADIPEDVVSTPETSLDTQPDSLPPSESADTGSGTDYTELLLDIDGLLYQHNYDFKSIISVSGNTIMITPDDNTTATLTAIADNQKTLIDGQAVLSGTVTLIFIAFMLHIVSRSVKRMVRYTMKGGRPID